MLSKSAVEAYLHKSRIQAIASEAISAVVSAQAPDARTALARQLEDMVASEGVQGVSARITLTPSHVAVTVAVTTFFGSTEGCVDVEPNAAAAVAAAALAAHAPAPAPAVAATSRPSTATSHSRSPTPPPRTSSSSASLVAACAAWSHAASDALRGCDPCDQLRADDAIMQVPLTLHDDAEDPARLLHALRLATSIAIVRMGARHARRSIASHIAALKAGIPVRQRGRPQHADSKLDGDGDVLPVIPRVPRLSFAVLAGGEAVTEAAGAVVASSAWQPFHRIALTLEPLSVSAATRDGQDAALGAAQRAYSLALSVHAHASVAAAARACLAAETPDGCLLLSSALTTGRAPTVDDALRVVEEALAAAVAPPREDVPPPSALPSSRGKPAAAATTSPRPVTAAVHASTGPVMLPSHGLGATLTVQVRGSFLHVDGDTVAREAAAAEAAAAASSKGKPGAKVGAKPASTAGAKGSGKGGKDAGATASAPAPAWAAEPSTFPISITSLAHGDEAGLQVHMYDWAAPRSRAHMIAAAAAAGDDNSGRMLLTPSRMCAILLEMTRAHACVHSLLDPVAHVDADAARALMAEGVPAAPSSDAAEEPRTPQVEIISSAASAAVCSALDAVFNTDARSLMGDAGVSHSPSAAALMVAHTRRHAHVCEEVFKARGAEFKSTSHTAALSMDSAPTVSAVILIARAVTRTGLRLVACRSTRVSATDAIEADVCVGIEADALVCGAVRSAATSACVERLQCILDAAVAGPGAPAAM